MTLRWETFADAANEAGISLRYGGIHFRAADLAGRLLGRLVAYHAWAKAQSYFDGPFRATQLKCLCRIKSHSKYPRDSSAGVEFSMSQLLTFLAHFLLQTVFDLVWGRSSTRWDVCQFRKQILHRLKAIITATTSSPLSGISCRNRNELL